MHILGAPRNKPLSNDSFGPATMVDSVKYYARARARFLHRAPRSAAGTPTLADGIDEF